MNDATMSPPPPPPRTFLGRFFYNNFRAVEENEEPFILQVYTGRERVTPLPYPLPPQTDAEKRFCRDDLEIEALDQHNYDFIAEILNSGQCTNQFHA